MSAALGKVGKTSESTGSNVPHSAASNRATFSISSLLLITTLIAVCMALIVAVPGLGILLSIFSLPPLVRTTILIRHRLKSGLPVETGSKVVWFLASLGTTMLITFATCCLSFVAFFVSCLVMIPIAGQGSGEQILLAVASIFTLIVAGLVLWLFSFWMRARWRRDTKD